MSAFTISNRLNSLHLVTHLVLLLIQQVQDQVRDAVYCTKAVQLENNSKALDIRLTANIRSTSEVEMYFRTSGFR